MKKIQKFLSDLIKAIVALFVILFLYILFIYEEPTQTQSMTEINTTSSNIAIKLPSDKNTTITTKQAALQEKSLTFMETRREAIKDVLTNHYGMKIRKNDLCEDNSKSICTEILHAITDKENEYKDIWINFSHNSVEVYTNEKVKPIDYITTCSAVMIGVTDANKDLVENAIFQAFNDASKTELGVEGNMLGIEVSIVPNYRGILGCKFYKY